MTYWSSTSMISRGFGRCERALAAFSSSSSRMMSLHSSTHSSQMNTDGPAISLRTSCWLFPQNEQYSTWPPSPPLPCRSSLIVAFYPWCPCRDCGGSVPAPSAMNVKANPKVRPENTTASQGHRGHATGGRIGRIDASAGLDGLFGAALEHGVDEAV